MKKMYFLIPIAIWAIAYFVLQIPIGDEPSGKGIWLLITDGGLIIATVATTVWALVKNDCI